MPASIEGLPPPWATGGFWFTMGFWGTLPWLEAMVWPPEAGSRMNLKISNESGFSGVAAVIPKVFPAGRET